MQDLISLGPGPATPRESASPTRASRTRDRAADTDAPSTNLSFDLMLAMAALSQQPAQPQSTTPNGLVIPGDGQAEDASLTGIADSASGTVERAPRFTTWRGRVEEPADAHTGTYPANQPGVTREQWGARIHNLFDHINAHAPVAGESPSTGNERRASNLLTLEGDARQASPREAGARQRPVTGGSQQPTHTDSATAGITLRTTRSGGQIEGTHATVEGLRPEAPAAGTDRRLHEAPSLTVVARNDQPVESTGTVHPAQLRVIHPDGTISYPRPDFDLIERLADSWRHSFAGDDIQLADAEAERTQFDELATGDADFAAMADTDAGTLRLLEGREADQRGMTGDEGGQTERQASRSEAARPATVVPLFGDLMAAEAPQPEARTDAPVGARRAVVEIAGEAFRLEQTGGSELSFTMKLAPEHLGQLEIEIMRVDERWSISITTAGDAAREALAAEIHRLEQALRDHNLTLDDVSIVTRGQEPANTAPSAPEQAANPDWFGGQDRQPFGGSQNWDESGWRATRGRDTIGLDSGRESGVEAALSARPAHAPQSGIDIQA